MYLAVTHDNTGILLTTQQYQAVNKIITNSSAQWLDIAGAKYHINSLKYIGPKSDYAGRVNLPPKTEAPAISAPSGAARLFIEGDASLLPAGQRERWRQIWIDHVKRRPAINARMAPLRLKAWQAWNANLPDGHPMKDRQPPRLLEPGYSSEELKIINSPA